MKIEEAAGITWKRCEPPVSDEIVDELERILKVTFPADFRHVMQHCHGGVPIDRSDFHFDHPTIGRPIRSGIGALMTLYPDATGGILTTLRLLAIDDQLPDRVIPFADDGGGDMMCLDYRENPDIPKIVYWAHEEAKAQSLIPLANSFSEFLDQLLPPSRP